MFRYATSVYGQTVLVGASWQQLWWFVGAGAAFIVVHAVAKAVMGARTTMPER
jgi:hypothetical protein